MSPTASLLDSLKERRPEWTPWLRIVELTLREAKEPAWSAVVPMPPPTSASAAPCLDGATIALPASLLETYVERLIGTAATSGTREMATLRGASMRGHALELFRAALRQEEADIAQAAAGHGVDPGALQAVAALLPVPFLLACTRSWGAAPEWIEPYCPLCGAWPAFAEVRGIERTRHYRCSRCGSDWHAHGLSCPFCGTTDHKDLTRLVPGDPAASSFVDACRKCSGYVKSFNRLQGCAPPAVLLEELGGVALDLAALENGYSRPAAPGYRIDVSVTAR